MLISGASKQISCAILNIFDLIIYWRFDLSPFFLYPKIPYHVVDCGFYKNDEHMIFLDLGWPFHRLTVKKTWMNDSWTVFFLDIINLIHICKTLSMLQSSNSLTDTSDLWQVSKTQNAVAVATKTIFCNIKYVVSLLKCILQGNTV